MSYKTYEKYIDSHVEWFNEIPEHWNLSKIKNMIDYYTNGAWGSEKQNDINDVICIRIADFDYPKRNIKDIDYTIRNISLNKRLLLKPGDLLIEKSGGGENQPVGRVVIFDKEFKATFSNFISKLKIKEGYDSRFLCYMFNMLYSSKVNTKSIKQTTGIQNLDSYAYFDEIIAIPNYIEQKQIANYLDKKTAKIDETITKNQQLIELLEEKRTALINQVVTKGLNPDVSMKDSGVEWIGEIPEHWDINNLNYAASDENYSFVDGPFGSDLKNEEYVDEGIPIIQLNNIKVGFHDFSNERFITEEKYNQLKKHSIKPGHIVIAKMAEPVARGTIVSDKYDKYTIVADCIKLACNNKFSNKYVTYSLNSYIYHEAIQKATGTTRVRINLQEMKKLKLLIPPLEEQNRISDYLDDEISKINQTIDKIQETIDLLEEYKTSLIHHVVTGKIDVRGEEI